MRVNCAVSVVVKDASTIQLLNYVGFNPNCTPVELVIVNDVNDAPIIREIYITAAANNQDGGDSPYTK